MEFKSLDVLKDSLCTIQKNSKQPKCSESLLIIYYLSKGIPSDWRAFYFIQCTKTHNILITQ